MHSSHAGRRPPLRHENAEVDEGRISDSAVPAASVPLSFYLQAGNIPPAPSLEDIYGARDHDGDGRGFGEGAGISARGIPRVDRKGEDEDDDYYHDYEDWTDAASDANLGGSERASPARTLTLDRLVAKTIPTIAAIPPPDLEFPSTAQLEILWPPWPDEARGDDDGDGDGNGNGNSTTREDLVMEAEGGDTTAFLAGSSQLAQDAVESARRERDLSQLWSSVGLTSDMTRNLGDGASVSEARRFLGLPLSRPSPPALGNDRGSGGAAASSGSVPGPSSASCVARAPSGSRAPETEGDENVDLTGSDADDTTGIRVDSSDRRPGGDGRDGTSHREDFALQEGESWTRLRPIGGGRTDGDSNISGRGGEVVPLGVPRGSSQSSLESSGMNAWPDGGREANAEARARCGQSQYQQIEGGEGRERGQDAPLSAPFSSARSEDTGLWLNRVVESGAFVPLPLTPANGDPGGSNESTSQLASGEDDGERRGSSKSASNLSTNRRKSRENLTVAIKTIRSPFSSVSAHFLDEIVPVPVTIEPRTESRFAIGCSRFASIVDTF